MTKSTERKIIFALMAVLLAAICTSAVVTIVRFLKEPASASIVAPSSIGRGISVEIRLLGLRLDDGKTLF